MQTFYKKQKIYLFIFILIFSARPWPVVSQTMEMIDSFFLQSKTAIRSEINGQSITTDFPLYNHIVNNKKGRILPGVIAEDRKVTSDYNFYGVSFEDRIYLNNVRFLGNVDLSLCDFPKTFKLQTTFFEKPVLFNWAYFRSDAIFMRAHFKSGVQFTRVNFDSSANFKFSQFSSNAFFFGSVFNGNTSFNDTKFLNEAIFSFTEYYSSPQFQRTEFNTIGRFNNTIFHQGANFSNAIFDSLADFTNASVSGIMDFSYTDLPAYMDMSNIQNIDGEINLMKANASTLKNICQINLLNSDISRFKLNYNIFSLYFPAGVTYDEKVKVYEDLLENFKKNELEASYQKLDIEFSQFKYKEKRQSATNIIQKAWWNYGYDKNMIFIWIFRIILIFTIINTLFIKQLISAITEMPFLTRNAVKKHSLHHPIIAYFLNFPGTFLYTFILILSGSTGLSIIKDHTRIPNVVWMIYVIILSLIGFSLSLFIFNYIIN